ncbi:MAG: hypothetical protein PHW76_03635 [Alphaproteobacteria bacterium]|nr:hypothetical protein [Alphaproteobacteria bacterium]
MQPAKFVTAIGSYRPSEQNDGPDEKKRFEQIAEAVGEALCYQGVNLRIFWSNDHVEDQCVPLDKNSVTHRLDGLRETAPENVKYLFEATADFHVMKGFLKAAKQDPAIGGKVELLISEQMWSGKNREPGAFVWPSISQKAIGDQSLGSLVETGLVRLRMISDKIPGENRHYLRSTQVSDMVNDLSPLGDPVDAMLIIGGGKATNTAQSVGFNQGRIIPIPHCGAEGLAALKKYFAVTKDAQKYGGKYPALYELAVKVTSVLTPPSETWAEYTTMSAEAVKNVLPRILSEFFASPNDNQPTLKSGRTSDFTPK